MKYSFVEKLVFLHGARPAIYTSFKVHRLKVLVAPFVCKLQAYRIRPMEKAY